MQSVIREEYQKWTYEVFKTKELQSHLVLVTPDIAESWLLRNTRNRRIQPDRVALYRKKWKPEAS